MASNACFPTRAIYTKQMLNSTPMSGQERLLPSAPSYELQVIFYALSLSSTLFGFLGALWELAATGWNPYWTLLKPNLLSLLLAALSHYGYNFFGFVLVAEVSSL